MYSKSLNAFHDTATFYLQNISSKAFIEPVNGKVELLEAIYVQVSPKFLQTEIPYRMYEITFSIL